MKLLRPLTNAARQASRGLVLGWKVVFLTIALAVGVAALGFLLSPLGGLVGGLLLGIAMLLAIVQFYTWCLRLHEGESIDWSDALGLRDHVFSNIAFVGFILWVTFALVNPMGDSTQNTIALILKLVAAFALNPIVEVCVLGRGAQGTLFTEAFRIAKDHLLIWFTPIIVLIVAGALVSGITPNITDLVFDFARSFQLLIPSYYLVSITGAIIQNTWLSLVLAAPLGLWFALFRIALLEELDR